ncbi:MAG: sigma factor-like helix-turn-helix DNA-binding protein [Flavobacteriales bacterium]
MFIEGFHYDEIAEELSIPMGTVKSRIYHARKKLAVKLVDYR